MRRCPGLLACSAPILKSIASGSLPKVGTGRYDRLIEVVGDVLRGGGIGGLLATLLSRVTRGNVNGHIHSQIFNAPDGLLPSHRILTVVDLGRLVDPSQIAPSRSNLEVLPLVQYRLRLLSGFLLLLMMRVMLIMVKMLLLVVRVGVRLAELLGLVGCRSLLGWLEVLPVIVL